MKILLDTHILLWYLWGDKSLSEKVKELISNPQNIKLFSIVSLWEIAIKNSIGKLDLNGKLEDLIPEQIVILPIFPAHVYQVQKLPFHHKDPFDRILIAQAMVEGIPLVSDDDNFKYYEVSMINN